MNKNNKDNKNNMLDNIPRLQWACRRGMLELDLILGNFLRNGYPTLNEDDKHRFVALLECADPELFAWLMGHAQPEDQELMTIVEIIRSHVRKRI